MYTYSNADSIADERTLPFACCFDSPANQAPMHAVGPAFRPGSMIIEPLPLKRSKVGVGRVKLVLQLRVLGSV